MNATAKQSAQTRFTSLLQYLGECPLSSIRRQKRQASAGVDEVTVENYPEDNLRDHLDLKGFSGMATYYGISSAASHAARLLAQRPATPL